jgi:inositol hexakisphosphate/diphosphoinositol-pentakisphosphate kinase
LTRRKYYDDCAQILSEHILAHVKPAELKTFSTLDPLVTTSLNRTTGMTLADAAREIAMQRDNSSHSASTDEVDQHSASNSVGALATTTTTTTVPVADPTGELLSSAATTLREGALPVREFPANLSSQPASLNHSANSSVVEEKGIRRQSSSRSTLETHQEELRCVLAIIRHGDRTPKQKLKVNLGEPHILRYFHE